MRFKVGEKFIDTFNGNEYRVEAIVKAYAYIKRVYGDNEPYVIGVHELENRDRYVDSWNKRIQKLFHE